VRARLLKSTPRSDKSLAFCVVWCMLVTAGAGCSTPQVESSLTDDYAGLDIDSRMSFWHELADRPLASHDEAFHALLLFSQQSTAPEEGYAGRVATMKQIGWLSEDFAGQPNEAIRRDTLAYVMVRMLDMEGGLMMAISDRNPHYSAKEMVYQGLMPAGSNWQVVSGRQLVGMVGLAEDYLQNQGRPLVARPSMNLMPGEQPHSQSHGPEHEQEKELEKQDPVVQSEQTDHVEVEKEYRDEHPDKP